MGFFFSPLSSRALSLPVLWLRWWAHGKQSGSRGRGVHLQVSGFLISSSPGRNQSQAAGTRDPAARCPLPGFSDSLRPSVPLQAAGEPGERALLAQSVPRKRVEWGVLPGRRGRLGPLWERSRCQQVRDPSRRGPGRDRLRLLPCFSQPDPTARPSVSRSWYSF